MIAPPTVSVVGSVSGIAGSGSDLQSVSGVTTTSAADPALVSVHCHGDRKKIDPD